MEVVDVLEQAYLQGEDEEIIEALTEYLVREWGDQAETWLLRFERAVAQQGLTVEVIERFLNEGNTLLGSRFASRVRANIDATRELVYETNLLAGVLQAGGDSARRSIVDERMLDWLEEFDVYWVRNHYGSGVRGQLKKAAAEIQTSGAGRSAGVPMRSAADRDRPLAFQKMRERMSEVLVGEQSNNYWELVSASITVRTQALSRIEAFARMGVEEYEIVATIDRVTSDICRYLDGMRFSVSNAVEHRDKLLDVDRSQQDWPERVKAISPWLPESRIIGKSEEQLASMGVLFPPFHGHCRTIIGPVLGGEARGPIDTRR